MKNKRRKAGYSIVEILVALGTVSIFALGIYSLFNNQTSNEKREDFEKDIYELRRLVSFDLNCETTRSNAGGDLCTDPYMEIWGNGLDPIIAAPSPNTSSGTPQIIMKDYYVRAKCQTDSTLHGGSRILVEYRRVKDTSAAYKDLFNGVPFPCLTAI